jgi:hypothetical protein
MKFEQLRPKFLEMEFDEQVNFISEYIEKRTNDLQKVLVSFDTAKAKKSPAKKDKQIKLTTVQMNLLKQLGLI